MTNSLAGIRRTVVVALAVATLAAACSSATTVADTTRASDQPPSTTSTATAPSTSLLPLAGALAQPGSGESSSASDSDAILVVAVTDGDTIVVLIDGVEEHLRLIGINTPEKNECLAAEATAAMDELVADHMVTLLSDVNDRDIYDRLLRYVYVDGVFVNEAMVAAGFALARRYEPDTAMADLLDAAQERAKEAALGMWKPDACGAASDADVVIEFIRYDADGNDNENMNDEWAVVKNNSPAPLNMSGWILKDESASHRFHFPVNFTLGASDRVTVRSGCGIDTANELFWCNSGSAIWNNSGDTGFLLDPSGNIVDEYGY